MTREFQDLAELARTDGAAFAAIPRSECLAAARAYAGEQRAVIRERHATGEGGKNVMRMLTNAADTLLQGVFNFSLASVPNRRALLSRLSLTAQGGYGRAELSPCSDLDVCLLFEGPLDEHLQALNSFLVPFLWDVGFNFGYTTRSVQETFALAQRDVKVFTSILEGRLIAGDTTPYARLRLLIRELQPKDVREMFDELRARNRAEFMPEEYRELYDPEPNLKEGTGGLRDYHVALWLFAVTHGVQSLDEVVSQGFLTPEEHLEISSALDFVWRIRNELHFSTGKASDVLAFAGQKQIAHAFGYSEAADDHIARLMEDYYAAARSLRRLLRIAVQTCDSSADRRMRERLQLENKAISVMGTELYAAVDDPNWFAESPARLMRVFWECARKNVSLSRATEREIRQNLHLINESFRSSDLVRQTFLAICNRPFQAGHALRQADHAGVLGTYLPEFEAIKGVIRYEDFHHYPVDEHTLQAIEALANVREMDGVVARCLRRALEHLSDPYILVLAILFHDLGKAAGEVHVEEGVRISNAICRRIGLPEEDAERIAFLVQHHLLMTSLSQYRDTDDEHIVRSFADTMRTEERLRALFLLSYADMAAVGPNVWNEWKGALLMKLYLKAEKMLMGRAMTVGERFWESEKADEVRRYVDDSLRPEVGTHLQDMGDRYFVAFSSQQIAVHMISIAQARETGLSVRCTANAETGMSEVVVCTRDRHGLFSVIAGSFASQLIDVNGAALFTRSDGLVVDCFTVRDAVRQAPLTDHQADAIEKVLRETLLEGKDIQEYVDRSRRRLFALLQPAIPVPTRIEFDNESSRTHTVIDIHTGDRTGLLYDITAAMAEAGLDIATARIVTDARRVRDSFYVTLNNTKIAPGGMQDDIHSRLHESIHPRPAKESKGGSQ